MDINDWVNKSVSPTLEIKTLYFVETDARHIAYSVPPSRYTGALKLIRVATDPLLDILIWLGSKLTSEKGRTFWVGYPFCIVLNWNVNGISVSSLVSKKTSQLVKNTPVASKTKKDCAIGSYQPIICSLSTDETILLPTICVPDVFLIASSSNCCLFSTLAFLTEIIFSWTVSRVPLAENASSEIVVATFWLFKLLFVNVSTLVPVANLGWILLFGFGIKKLPINTAPRSEINLTFVIVALAPLVLPIKVIPDSTQPLNSPWGAFANEKVSTFKILEVEEYVADNLVIDGTSSPVAKVPPVPPAALLIMVVVVENVFGLYGLSANVVIGKL